MPPLEQNTSDSEGDEAVGNMIEEALDILDEHQTIWDRLINKTIARIECTCFFMFLGVFTAMTVLHAGTGSYAQTLSIRQSLIDSDEFTSWNGNGQKSFEDISTIDDIYNYLETVALPFLLNPETDFYVQSQQRLLGGIRLKQARATERPCEVKEFVGHICYDSSDFFEGTAVFSYSNHSERRRRLNAAEIDAPTLEPTLEPTAFPTATLMEWTTIVGTDSTDSADAEFEYFDLSELDDQPYRGKYGTYPGGGYIVDLPLDEEQALSDVANLRAISWLDGATQFLAMDFNTFNPSTGLHTVARIYFEMPSGGVFPGDEIKTWKFERYDGASGTALMAFHILFLIFVVAQTVMEFTNCYRLGCWGRQSRYWTGHLLKNGELIANLVICYSIIAIFVYDEHVRTSQIDIYSTSQFVSFRRLQFGFTWESMALSVNGVLLWLRLFQFLGMVSARLQFLFTMLKRSATDIFMFFIVLVVFIFGFGTAGFIAFNSDVSDFRSYGFTIGNMFRFVLVDMDYDALTRSSSNWGAVFYFVWSLMMLLVLANVFIAILTEAYSEVQMDLEDDLDPNKLLGNFTKMVLGEKTVEKLNKLRVDDFDDDGDGQIDAHELAQRTNLSVHEAKDFIKSVDIDNTGTLNAKELKKLIAEKQDNSTGPSRAELRALKRDMDGILDLLHTVLGQTNAGRKALSAHEKEKQKRARQEHVHHVSSKGSPHLGTQ